MTNSKPTIAWLGTGLMGSPMARRLLRHGYVVRVWNRTRAKAQALETAGAEVFDSPEQAVSAADWVFTTLSDFNATETVLKQIDPKARIIVQMATIAPDQSRVLDQQVVQGGGVYLEAPVLGSIPEAENGRLIIMAGGSKSSFGQALETLQVLSEQPRWIGTVGEAAALKLALNQLIASLTVAFSTSLAYVEHHGVEVATFVEILRNSALYAPTFDKKLPRMQSHDYHNPNFPTEHLVKDIDLFLQSRDGIASAPLELILSLYEHALAAHRFEDYSCVFEVVRRASRKKR